MIRLIEQLAADSVVAAAPSTVTLPFADRQRSRLRTQLDDGREAGLFLPRGTILRHGDLLRAEDGPLVRVRAAAEAVSTARHEDPWRLARACYHLGNRHVALQIGSGWVRYLHDHVLDALAVELGLQVVFERAPFEPEAGAFHGGHGGGHSHGH
ncbi:MAG: urease accessory protein UreE [Chromatiales bacterium 21-64-14]|nr:MAG: urease accessory protein UreE [Chromatiales bacterium 21-64-14]HQU16899.1 urease accessory protein UreE [Gammaproteobacteria bacterium]